MGDDFLGTTETIILCLPSLHPQPDEDAPSVHQLLPNEHLTAIGIQTGNS